MNRIFIASEDRDEAEWISDELKEYGRVVRVVDSLDFFVPQWESVEANVVIFMESIIHSEESFVKLIHKIRSDKLATIIMFVYYREDDDFIKSLSNDDIHCISYMDLEPGVIETRLTGVTVVSFQQTPITNERRDIPNDEAFQKQELEPSQLDEGTTDCNEKHDNEKSTEQIEQQVDSAKTAALTESAKVITRQISEAGNKLFNIIESKKVLIQERNKQSLVESVKPDELDFEPITKNISKKKRRDRFVGTAVIAITGTESGVGTTHTAIMIANYLARQEYSVILVEANENKDFVEIEAAYEGIVDTRQIKTSAFNINGVRYQKNVTDLNMVHLLSANYSYILLDLGHYQYTEWYEEFLRANISIVVGSGSEWNQKNIYDFFREQIHHDQSKWKLCVPLVEKQVIGDIRKQLPKRKVYGLPYHPDPYKENKEIDSLIEDILKINQYQKLTLLKRKMQAIFQ